MLPYVNEFRTDKAANYYLDRISKAAPSDPLTIMEICGGHTLTIVRYGLQELLPKQIRLLSGPGCPVCVTSQEYIDTAIELSKLPDMIIASFGDMLRVPGSKGSLAGQKSRGADIRVCLSSLDALELARKNPDREVIFLGIGFETTAPTIAHALYTAAQDKCKNFSVLSALKVIPPAMHALLKSGEVNIGGFICPGHVSAITGTEIYEQIAKSYGIPCVVSGFEPVDLLSSIAMILSQLKSGRAEVENQYTRTVKKQGNRRALSLIAEVFREQDAVWRGLGVIAKSGLQIRDAYKAYDAAQRFTITLPESREHPACICGAVMRGVKQPLDCTLFNTLCTPQNPVGACMVSAEGSCGIYYKYARK
jgi:hydrogenase expression/formation protein HypD